MVERRRRLILLVIVIVLSFGGAAYTNWQDQPDNAGPQPTEAPAQQSTNSQQLASEVLDALAVKGRSPRSGYTREQFGEGWQEIDGCDFRNLILQRDLEGVVMQDDNCSVQRGRLRDPYTGNTIDFVRGAATSQSVQIDHVVALSDAWQKGAQTLSFNQRLRFANDPLNLLAVDGPTNINKGGADAASWLPPHKPYRCLYIARQISVKAKYQLWVTDAEAAAMRRILNTCPTQTLPIVAA